MTTLPETPSEKTQAKAAEYLLAGRVRVKTLLDDGQNITFRAHAYSASQDGDPYFVKFTSALGWTCDCPAHVQLCSHVVACMTITDFGDVKPEPVTFSADTDIDKLLGI